MRSAYRAYVEQVLYTPVFTELAFLAFMPLVRSVVGTGYDYWVMVGVIGTTVFAGDNPFEYVPGFAPRQRFRELGGRTLEQGGHDLVTAMKSGAERPPFVDGLATLAEEGNVDELHFEAALWVWLAGWWYDDRRLEQSGRVTCLMYLNEVDARAGGRWLRPRYLAWDARRRMELRSTDRVLPRLDGSTPPGRASAN